MGRVCAIWAGAETANGGGLPLGVLYNTIPYAHFQTTLKNFGGRLPFFRRQGFAPRGVSKGATRACVGAGRVSGRACCSAAMRMLQRNGA